MARRVTTSPTTRRLAAFVLLALTVSASTAHAQVFELRRLFERFESGKVLVGGMIAGPLTSQLNPETPRTNVPFDIAAEFDGQVSVDYWQLRAGVTATMISAVMPFLYWNPIIGDDFGGDNSRWSGTVGAEFAFQSTDDDYDPRKTYQTDNSIFSPQTSFSFMVGYWFGQRGKTLRVDTNYIGRGFVDTSDYRTPPLDTASFVRGTLMPSEVPSAERGGLRFTSRNGFSAGVGFGTGKYSGSGPITKYLNFLHPSDDELENNDTSVFYGGLNPMLQARYRYEDYIAQLEIAGEDINLGLIYRGFGDFDVELGAQYLEHLFDRPSRGPNRPRLFLGVRYSPLGPDSYELGDEVYDPSSDSDGDGLPDGDERSVTFTDPSNPDTDGDGLPDGLEVYSYRSNPTIPDSDGDGLIDGQEIGGQIRTDPLRSDTDGDGISDGEEVNNGTDPLQPGEGIRGR
jgi:hypothetical protein